MDITMVSGQARVRFSIQRTNRERKIPPSPRTLDRAKKSQRNVAPPHMAAPFLSIPNRIGMPRIREEEPPHGAKGTTSEPFDGGALTFEVLTHEIGRASCRERVSR